MNFQKWELFSGSPVTRVVRGVTVLVPNLKVSSSIGLATNLSRTKNGGRKKSVQIPSKLKVLVPPTLGKETMFDNVGKETMFDNV